MAAIVDISDMDSPLWERFDVEIVPTLVGFKDGKPLVRKNGIPGVGLSAQELDEVLREMQ